MINFKSLLTRAATGVIYIGIILGCILTDQVALMTWVLALFAVLGTYEYQVLTKANLYAITLKIWHSLMAGLPLYIAYSLVDYSGEWRHLLMAALPYFAYILFYLIGEIYRYRHNPAKELGHAFFAHLYTALPLALLVLTMGDRYSSTGALWNHQPLPRTFWLLPIFVTIWLNDTGAYLFGLLLGRHKLFERVSPNKSWEGAIGGGIIALLGAVAFYYAVPSVTSLTNWMLFALIIVIFGNFGDLFESYIKRSSHVKDSGQILPGHGGMLDRIDSLLFVAIPIFLYINLVIL